jgi:hypothetical protein
MQADHIATNPVAFGPAIVRVADPIMPRLDLFVPV